MKKTGNFSRQMGLKIDCAAKVYYPTPAIWLYNNLYYAKELVKTIAYVCHHSIFTGHRPV
ncbi:hypothetical protein QLH32_11355 [Acinetobacter corruptisaponis]|uniref:Uncharacterized protein n=1 Tax=Acinetobacter corruptisaponis TaxID=3045147 RepID=A0ABY8RZG0_9GAMM|nr:hypothetical protein [Acinetobacter sp. KCTC 92772]WHP04650.1 hypothetical protein QLH32_11355 [Acinetobacter sp. KCTC 92772]